MRYAIPILLAVLVAACTAQKLRLDEEAVDDFVAVRDLESLESIRVDSSDNWTDLNDRYLWYRTRRGEYLVHFSRPCWEIRDDVVVADTRWEPNRVRARFDTIRGCRIAEIFALGEADIHELENLGPAPGGSN